MLAALVVAAWALALPAAPQATSSSAATPDAPIREMLAAVAAATTLAYTAEFVREELDLPTGERTTSSVRGQVWMERREVAGSPAAATAGLPWKIALSTVLDDDAVEFEGAVALWAYDGERLCMLHPEKQRAD